jgi:hypothetical protein
VIGVTSLLASHHCKRVLLSLVANLMPGDIVPARHQNHWPSYTPCELCRSGLEFHLRFAGRKPNDLAVNVSFIEMCSVLRRNEVNDDDWMLGTCVEHRSRGSS